LQEAADTHFPQISRAYDLALMQERFQERLFLSKKNPPRIQACRMGEARYKPGKSCVIAYRLEILDFETKLLREQVVCGRLCPPGKGLAEFQRAKTKALFPLAGMQPLLYLDDPEMLLWVFPNDRKLSGLPQMLDVVFLRNVFPKMLSILALDASNRLLKITPQIVHYLPERSCMIRYELTLDQPLNQRVSEERPPLTIYGKVFPDEGGREIYETMRQLSAQMAPGQTAQALAYDPELKALWQSEVPGRPLTEEPISSAGYLRIIEAVARCVAAFHSTKVEGLQVFDREEIYRLLKKTLVLVEERHAHLSGRVKALVDRLLACAARPGFFPSHHTPIHRDLKLGNMLLHEGRVGLIDMDCVCLGDPLNDVGSFVANFYLNGLYADCEAAALRERVEIFCRAYAAQVHWPMSQKALCWYVSASFLYEVLRRSIRQQNPRRLKYLEKFLDLSASYCPAWDEDAHVGN